MTDSLESSVLTAAGWQQDEFREKLAAVPPAAKLVFAARCVARAEKIREESERRDSSDVTTSSPYNRVLKFAADFDEQIQRGRAKVASLSTAVERLGSEPDFRIESADWVASMAYYFAASAVDIAYDKNIGRHFKQSAWGDLAVLEKLNRTPPPAAYNAPLEQLMADDSPLGPLWPAGALERFYGSPAGESSDLPPGAAPPGGVLTDQYEAFNWFHREFNAGRLAEHAGRYVALHGRCIVASEDDVRTVTDNALKVGEIDPGRRVITFAGHPHD